jgi:hypothetical protein
MCQLLTLSDGHKIVSTDLSEQIKLTLMRLRGPPVLIVITSEETEPRLFDEARLPILTIDDDNTIDFHDGVIMQNLVNNSEEVFCVPEEHSVATRIWSGDEIGPNASILQR